MNTTINYHVPPSVETRQGKQYYLNTTATESTCKGRVRIATVILRRVSRIQAPIVYCTNGQEVCSSSQQLSRGQQARMYLQ